MRIGRQKRGRLLRNIIVGGFFAAASAAFSVVSPVRAEGTFIAAADRVDFVHDTQRGVIYISSGAQILRYDLATNKFLPPIYIGRATGQMDISPEGNVLAVATTPLSGTTSLSDSPTFVLISLGANNAVSQIPVYSVNVGYGAMSVAFDNAGTLFVVPQLDSSGAAGKMWRYDLRTGSAIALPDYGLSRPLLQPSPNREAIGVAERGDDGGKWGIFDVPSSSLTFPPSRESNGTHQFNYEIGVSGDATQFGLPTYGGAMIYNGAGALSRQLGSLSNPENTGLGIAYNPVLPRVYIPWANTNEVRVFDTSTFAQVGSYNFETNFNWQNAKSWKKGHTRVSEDGSLLMVSVDGGVRFVQLAPSSPKVRSFRAIGAVYSFNEDSAYQFKLGYAGGSPTQSVTYDIVDAPQNGTLTGTGSERVYTPKPNFNGIDKFRFRVTQDGNVAYAAVTLNIKPVDDPPTQLPVAPVQVHKGGSVSIPTSTPFDPDGPLTNYTYSVVRQGAGGTATTDQEGRALIYRPRAGFIGTDSFDFVVTSNHENGTPGLNSLPVKAQVTVVDNAAPVAQDDNYSNVSRSNVFLLPAPGVLANDSDPDGDPISVKRGVDSVSWGSATISPDGALRWEPGDPQSLTDSKVTITYYVYDNLGAGNKATVTLKFGSPNTASAKATATAQTVTTPKNIALPIKLSATDDPSLAYAVTVQPTHGTLTGTGTIRTYTPAANYSGTDEFTFSVISADDSSSSAKVTIMVTAGTSVTPPVKASAPPVASAQTVSTLEDTAKSIVLSVTYPDGAPTPGSAGSFIAYRISRKPTFGSMGSVTDATSTYTPNANFFGTDSFEFEVSTSRTAFTPISRATVTLNVTPVNDLPVAQSATYTIAEDTPLKLTLGASDVEENPLTYVIDQQPANGTLSGTAPNLIFTPKANFNGTTTFSFHAHDGFGAGNIATITINVTPAPEEFSAEADSYTTNEDTVLSIAAPGVLTNDSSLKGVTMTAEIKTQPAHGAITLNANGSFSYKPAANYNGPDSFTYRTGDGVKWSDVATVQIKVVPVNDAPQSEAWNKSVSANGSFSFTPTLRDRDGDSLMYSIKTAPLHGSLVLKNNEYVYTPTPNYTGDDVLIIEGTDGGGLKGKLSVYITVAPLAPAQP